MLRVKFGFFIKTRPVKNPIKTRLDKKKPDPIPYYINGAGRGGFFGMGLGGYPRVAGLLPSLVMQPFTTIIKTKLTQEANSKHDLIYLIRYNPTK
jgi:hypothetical protein